MHAPLTETILGVVGRDGVEPSTYWFSVTPHQLFYQLNYLPITARVESKSLATYYTYSDIATYYAHLQRTPFASVFFENAI